MHNRKRRIDFETFELFVIYSLETVMTQLDDVNAALSDANAKLDAQAAAITQLQTDVATGITTLTAEIQAAQQANPTADLSGVLAAAQALSAKAQTNTAAIQGVDTTVTTATAGGVPPTPGA